MNLNAPMTMPAWQWWLWPLAWFSSGVINGYFWGRRDGRAQKLKHKMKLVAARRDDLAASALAPAGPVTYVLSRCSCGCGQMSTDVMRGHWTPEELGLSLPAAKEMVEGLVRGKP